MSALAALLQRRIRQTGPLTVAAYMAEALGHPVHGYYMSRNPFGARGDFTTAPEISQMFGELIGLWCRVVWEAMGRPRPWSLVELGPGRGTLMADALRGLGPACEDARIHLVETSSALRAIQEATLRGQPVTWHATFESVPPGSILVVANELFDALPIHQVERTPGGWRERMIGVGGDGRLRFALAPGATAASVGLPRTAPPGTVAEVSPVAAALATTIADRVVSQGGAALIIDFASDQPGKATLQAVRTHRRADPLDDPGACDLAAAVDFERIAGLGLAAGARVFGPLRQGAFLADLGIDARAARLKERATPAQAAAIDAARTRLLGDDAMGRLFQALAFAHPSLAVLPGFPPC